MPEEHPICIAVAHLGGAATWAQLISDFSAHAVRQAVADGRLERVGRGRYVLPGLDVARREAARLGGVVSHRSAALQHGWEGLAVADPALRAAAVTEEELDLAPIPRFGRAKARRVLDLATFEAANPFESALRGIAAETVGALSVPQVWIRVAALQIRPDLVCEELLLDDWLPLRFAWDHVMWNRSWVSRTLARGVERQRRLWAARPSPLRHFTRTSTRAPRHSAGFGTLAGEVPHLCSALTRHLVPRSPG